MKYFIHFLLCSLPLTSISQDFTYSLRTGSNTVYIGLDNFLSLSVETLKNDDVTLTTKNGTIKKLAKGLYNLHPDSSSIMTVKIQGKNLEEVGKLTLYINQIPNPRAVVGGREGGEISSGALAAQGGVGAIYPSFLNMDIYPPVKSYYLTIIRSGKVIFYKSYSEAKFSDDQKNIFRELQNDDIVLFSSIIAHLQNEKTLKLNTVLYTIENN